MLLIFQLVSAGLLRGGKKAQQVTSFDSVCILIEDINSDLFNINTKIGQQSNMSGTETVKTLKQGTDCISAV